MAAFALVILTLLSCIFFEYAKIYDTVRQLTASYKNQFKVMSDKELSDADKQSLLMQNVGKQLGLLLKLILGILFFIAPFLSLYLLERIHPDLKPDILITWWGICIPIITVLLYILIKRFYGRVFSNR